MQTLAAQVHLHSPQGAESCSEYLNEIVIDKTDQTPIVVPSTGDCREAVTHRLICHFKPCPVPVRPAMRRVPTSRRNVPSSGGETPLQPVHWQRRENSCSLHFPFLMNPFLFSVSFELMSFQNLLYGTYNEVL